MGISLKAHFKHTERILAVLLLAVLLGALGGLGGCKPTSVLTQHVEDEQLGKLDESANSIYRETENAPEDATRTTSVIDDSDRIDEQEQALPVYAQDAGEHGTTDIREQRGDSADTDEASTGNQSSYAEGDNEVAGEDDRTGQATSGEGEGEGESSTETSTGGEGDPGDLQSLAAGIGGAGETFDTTGTDYELPDGVSRVAAAGQYATIVQMLAGRGALVAADEEWVSTVTEQRLFPGEGVEDLTCGWRGDASTGLGIDIDAVVASAPDVVLVDGSQVKLDDAEQAHLKAAGIDVVVLPRLGGSDTPDDDVVKTVSIVGELLGGAETQYDATAMADEYVQQHDTVISACVQANGGYSYKMEYGASFPSVYQGTADSGVQTTQLSSTRYVTAFIDAWTMDVNASSTAIRRYANAALYLDGDTVDASEGAGLSIAIESKNFPLLAYYLQVSGVVDNSYEGVKPVSGGSGMASLPYLVVPGGTRNLITETTHAASRTTPSALWFAPTSTAASSGWLKVGDVGFPLLIVKDDDIAHRVVGSAAKVNGLYNVGSPYRVQVMPSGVCGSWADGTVESYLVSLWIEGLFKNDGNLERCKSYVDQFYGTFYRASADSALANFDTSYTALCTVK